MDILLSLYSVITDFPAAVKKQFLLEETAFLSCFSLIT